MLRIGVFTGFLLILPVAVSAQAQWVEKASPLNITSKVSSPLAKARYFTANLSELSSSLSVSATAKAKGQSKTINLPMPDGSAQDFTVEETYILSPEVAKEIPEFKTYKITSLQNPSTTGRVDVGRNGFHAMLFTEKGTVFINPESQKNTNSYYSFYKKDYLTPNKAPLSCGTDNTDAKLKFDMDTRYARTSGDLYEYRIAVATTSGYSAMVGADAMTVLTEIGVAINRIDGVYERDLGVSLVLVSGTNLIYPFAGADPYDGSNLSLMLDQNQTTIDSVVGSSNYDIGHIFSTSSEGGLASLGVVCNSSGKAQGGTGLTNPTGDPYYIDYVAHEIGHQFGATHTFNGTTSSCGGGNRTGLTAFEPGSASTIMGYSGICGAENLTPTGGTSNSDDIFHAASISQILVFTRSVSCHTLSTSGNTAPIVNAGADYVIPMRTPFELAGTATDVNGGDVLSYNWSQMDTGAASDSGSFGTDLGSNPLFRVYASTVAGNRTIPQLSTILSNTSDPEEVLPTTARTLNFRLTVRDGNGGVDEDDIKVTVAGSTSDAFSIIQPNVNADLDYAQPQVVEWNSACTEQAPVNCANVDILVSTDGGMSFSTLVGGTTPNDGSESVTFPSTVTTTARVKIACTNNIFFDVSNVDFQLSNGGATVLTSPGTGGSGTCTPPSAVIANMDIETNDTRAQAVPITIPVTFQGEVNSSTDRDDFFVFTPTVANNTFLLSGYGGYDLDLILQNSSGALVVESASFAGTTETFVAALTPGTTYYVLVQGFDTIGLNSSYTLSITEGGTPTPIGGGSGGGGGGGGGLLTPWTILLLFSGISLLRLRRSCC